MPRKIVTWECETCGRDHGYGGYEAARKCEIGHITDEALGKLKSDLKGVFRLRTNQDNRERG